MVEVRPPSRTLHLRLVPQHQRLPRARPGLARRKANWRGEAVSNVAQRLPGKEFATPTKSIVTEYVDSLCDH